MRVQSVPRAVAWSDALFPPKIRDRFGEDVGRIFTACPALEELVFSRCTGEEVLMKWERSFGEVEVVVAKRARRKAAKRETSVGGNKDVCI